MHGLPDDQVDMARAFYPPHVVHMAAARERLRHREMLTLEAERLARAAQHHQTEMERCLRERGRVLALRDGAAP